MDVCLSVWANYNELIHDGGLLLEASLFQVCERLQFAQMFSFLFTHFVKLFPSCSPLVCLLRRFLSLMIMITRFKEVATSQMPSTQTKAAARG